VIGVGGEEGGALALKLISLVADLIGIWTFVASNADRTERLAIGGGLALVALVAGANTMIGAIRLWLSPRGSYIRRDKRMRRVLDGLLVVCFGCLLIVGVIDAANASGGGSKTPPSTSAPAK